jgi:primosomal protein N' (replication factor Y)
MQVNVIVVGATRGTDALTYGVPPALQARVDVGHRVLVPLRSRHLTGVVIEKGDCLAPADSKLKPLIEVFDERPLFDHAHLDLMRFLANYYMVSLADAYRSIIPAVARVESRVNYHLAAEPDALARATFSAVERKVVDALAKRPMTARQLAKLDPPAEVRSALARLQVEGIVGRRDATRGRHRDAPKAAFIRAGAGANPVRGARQRAVLDALRDAGAGGAALDVLELQITGAKAALKPLIARGLVELRSLAPEAAIPDSAPAPSLHAFDLTEEQTVACQAIYPAIRSRRYETFLLWGVTASGKTEVYLRLAAEALAAGRQALVLVPEIALADEIVRSFRARFGSLVGIAHSGQTVAERWASWMSALRGDARIMIGPRSAIFAPLGDRGVIVVDEEHDAAYKNEEGIRYHARDLAVALGSFARCPVVLGSATPSAESFFNTRRGRYRMLALSRRVGDRPMAEVKVVDLRREAAEIRERDGRAPGSARAAVKNAELPVPLSSALIDALRQNLAAHGQSMVFLNRRGYHNFLQCQMCGTVIACDNCSVAMTFHMRDRSLRCHYCGSRLATPDLCPACGGYGLTGQGFGTERLVAALAHLLPDARIERMDSDTSGRRGERVRMLAALRHGEIDILVGTQMITKGFDFPGVTLAAVVLADLGLNLPDFRSAERTFQLLTQVAGRAGRGERAGQVLIQTYAPNHYSIRAARDQDFARFMRRELTLRREFGYPPFMRLAMVRIEGPDAPSVSRLAADAARHLNRNAGDGGIKVLGPAPAPIERIKQRWRWQVMVKSSAVAPLRNALGAMRAALQPRAERDGVFLIVDIDPVRMM